MEINDLTIGDLQRLVSAFGSKSNQEYRKLHGKKVAVYGPNFIWTGTLASETEKTILLTDVHQIYDTNSHSDDKADGERIADEMFHSKDAIINIGETKWAK